MNAYRRADDWIPVDPIREAVLEAEREGLSRSEICRRLGWTRERAKQPPRRRKDKRVPQADTSRLARRLGLLPNKDGNGDYTLVTVTIRYDIAVAIIRAIGRDPVDLGL